jgi:hypothetical protein
MFRKTAPKRNAPVPASPKRPTPQQIRRPGLRKKNGAVKSEQFNKLQQQFLRIRGML